MAKKGKDNKRPQMDGIIRRPNRAPIGDFEKKPKQKTLARRKIDESIEENPEAEILSTSIDDNKATDKSVVGMMDFSDIDEEEAPKSKRSWKFWRRKRSKVKKPWTKVRIIKRALLILGILILLTALYLGLRLFFATQSIIVRDGDGAPALSANIDPSQLNGEGDGRVNILLLGIGGETHTGGDLADSIIILSIDPFNNDAAMLSVPRDLYLEIPNFGSARVNAAHSYGESTNYPGGGIALTRESLEKALDINLHYFVRVDFEGFVQAVDAVGGITINLDEPLYDTNFWWQYGILDLPAGENYLDGEKALYVSRSRLTSPRGDFDRGDRQRDILIALKDKALSLGTFANPIKLASLIDTAGKHVRTNLQISEMLRIHEIAGGINFSKVDSVGLHNGPESYLASQSINGASVQVPRAGDFSEIQEFLRQLFPDGFIKKEAANIDVYNGSGISGRAKLVADELKTYTYKIQNTRNLKDANFTETTIVDLSGGEKPVTKRYLEQRFGVSTASSSSLPEGVNTTADFVIIVGSNYGQ